jgi:hypothetical protein
VTNYYITPAARLPEWLDAESLRLSWAAGHGSQVRDLVGCAAAPDLRRTVLELLRTDPCVQPSRRSAYRVLASASNRAMTASATDPLLP